MDTQMFKMLSGKESQMTQNLGFRDFKEVCSCCEHFYFIFHSKIHFISHCLNTYGFVIIKVRQRDVALYYFCTFECSIKA